MKIFDTEVRPSVPNMPIQFELDRFTEDARRVFSEAEGIANRMNHSRVDTGHLLYGVATQEKYLFGKMGLQPEQIEDGLRAVVGVGPPANNGLLLGYTEAAMRTMTSARDYLENHSEYHVDSHRLTLALLSYPTATAGMVLKKLDRKAEELIKTAEQVELAKRILHLFGSLNPRQAEGLQRNFGHSTK